MGQFLDVHVKLPIATVEQHLGNTLQPSYTFDRDDIQASVHRIETSLTASNTRLRELTAIAALATPPSKRRFAAEDPRFKRYVI